jgi:hypothetical protein
VPHRRHESDPNDITRMPFTIGLTAPEAVKLRQAIRRAQALGIARTEGDAMMRFVDSWLAGEGRRLR